MTLYKSDKVRFIFGLIFIVLIYSWFYIYFLENKNTAEIPRKLRHVITLFTTIAVYLVGTFHLGKLADSWMSSLWHLVHISGLIIISFIGLVDWLIGGVSLNIRSFALSIQELLISPVLYFAMGLLNKHLKKN